uniref:Uncharacterized protein ycf35 n=1 Tax=Callithamnion tetricum TaxID=193179 RepID=A0A4D6WN05_9FLOR|nr:hypothetical protein [Callithamnion tetricum]
MSHLSQIKTNIHDLNILKVTLKNLGFQYKSQLHHQLKNNIYEGIDLLVFQNSTTIRPIFGFIYDGNKYMLVTDIYFWKLDVSISSFIDKLTQAYALNIILDQANNDGFEMISQDYQLDGSIELVVQKWNS